MPFSYFSAGFAQLKAIGICVKNTVCFLLPGFYPWHLWRAHKSDEQKHWNSTII